MGKARRFNRYDRDVNNSREQLEQYGLTRQNAIGLSSTHSSLLTSPSTGGVLRKTLQNIHLIDPGPNVFLQMFRDDITPLDDDGLGSITWYGRNDNAVPEKIQYAIISVDSEDVSDNSEDGEMHITITETGVPTDYLVLRGVQADILAKKPIDLEANFAQFDERATPANPPANSGRFYAKDVGAVTKPMWLDSAGTETDLTAGGGGGISFPIEYPIVNHGNQSGTLSIDLSLNTAHVHTITLTGNLTITFTNPPASTDAIMFEIEFTQDATGGRTVSYTNTMNSEPTIDTDVSAVTVGIYQTIDGGTSYYGFDSQGGGGGSFTGANKALSNLENVAINTALLPNADETIDIGTAALAIQDIFVARLRIQDSSAAPTSTSPTTIGSSTTGSMFFNVDDTADLFDFYFNGSVLISFQQSGPDGLINTDILDIDQHIQLQDKTIDPAIDGVMARNGAHVKVHSGGAVRNLTDVGTLGDHLATQTLDIDTNHIQMQEITAPAAVASNIVLYAKDKGGTTELFYKNESNVERDLSALGHGPDIITEGDSKVEVIDTGVGTITMEIDGTEEISVGPNTVTVTGNCQIKGLADLQGNVRLGNAGSDKISSNGVYDKDILSDVTGQNIGGAGNEWTSLFLGGGSIFFNSGTTQAIKADANGMEFRVPTDDTYEWKINVVDEMTLSNNTLDIKNNDLINVGTFEFGNPDQKFVASTTEINYNVPTGDKHVFSINGIVNAKLEIRTDALICSQLVELAGTASDEGILDMADRTSSPGTKGTFGRLYVKDGNLKYKDPSGVEFNVAG